MRPFLTLEIHPRSCLGLPDQGREIASLAAKPALTVVWAWWYKRCLRKWIKQTHLWAESIGNPAGDVDFFPLHPP